MNHFNLTASDVAWMRQRIKASLMGLLVLAAFAVSLRGGRQATDNEKQGSSAQPAAAVASRRPFVSPPTAGENQGPGVRSRSVPPSGWRRTNRGWEHVSTWPSAARAASDVTLNEIIVSQRETEPQWIQHLFAALRSVPPLSYAVFQLAAIGVIAHLGSRRPNEKDVSGLERNSFAVKSTPVKAAKNSGSKFFSRRLTRRVRGHSNNRAVV